MKIKYIKSCIFILMFLIVACSTSPKRTAVPPQAVGLKLNESITFGELAITIKQINDNRCPKNANCIRQGEAVVVLNIVVNNKSERNINLCIGADCAARGLNESYKLSAEDKKYLFKLDSVTPYPRTNITEEKRAFFSVG